MTFEPFSNSDTVVVVGTISQRTKLRTGLLFRLTECSINDDSRQASDCNSCFLSKLNKEYTNLVLLTHKGYKISVEGTLSNGKCIQVADIELLERLTTKWTKFDNSDSYNKIDNGNIKPLCCYYRRQMIIHQTLQVKIPQQCLKTNCEKRNRHKLLPFDIKSIKKSIEQSKTSKSKIIEMEKYLNLNLKYKHDNNNNTKYKRNSILFDWIVKKSPLSVF